MSSLLAWVFTFREHVHTLMSYQVGSRVTLPWPLSFLGSHSPQTYGCSHMGVEFHKETKLVSIFPWKSQLVVIRVGMGRECSEMEKAEQGSCFCLQYTYSCLQHTV